jgi:putative tryptophan/tyrosine transport system substrate-binding protein
LAAKRLELLHETVPAVESIGWLRNPNLREAQIREVETAARTLGVRLISANVRAPSEIEPSFASLVGQKIGAVLVGNDVLANARNDQLLALAAGHKLPAIYPMRQFAEAGGLMSYEADLSDVVYLAALYAALILKGAKPAEMPVRKSTRFELVLNRNTAGRLGIELPGSIMSRADDVID